MRSGLIKEEYAKHVVAWENCGVFAMFSLVNAGFRMHLEIDSRIGGMSVKIGCTPQPSFIIFLYKC